MNRDGIIRTTHGAVSGVRVDTPCGIVHRFAGIPYAAPPVGPRRFAPPARAAAWDDVRPAHSFGPDPMQPTDGLFTGAVPGMGVTSVSEDCLTVNVWVPDGEAEPRPVLVWIYGGAFVIGGTSPPTYDGARLAAEQGVIVVSVNYRVGVFGFLDLRGVGGPTGAVPNCGLLDQLAALRWVAENAAVFGGDPDRVTVFGESAGAGSILHLLISPHRGALARRAIAQSPGVDFTQDAELAATVARRVLHRLGAPSSADVRTVGADLLLAAQTQAATDLLFEAGTMPFHPVVDGEVVPSTPSVAIASGAAAGVDLLIGATLHEMRLFRDPRSDELDDAGLTAWLRAYLRTRTVSEPSDATCARVLAAYRAEADGSNRSAGSDVWAAIQTDGVMRLPIERIASAQAAHNPYTYTYLFAWESRDHDRDPGAFHAIDLPFTFDTFDRDGWDAFLGIDDEARLLGARLRRAWAAFAATGNPSGDGVGTWPPYSPARPTMMLDTAPAVAQDPLAAPRALWEGLWDPSCRPAPIPV